MNSGKNSNRRKRIQVGERVTIYKSGKRGLYTADFHYQGHRTRSLATRNLKIAKRKAQLIDAELVNGTFRLDDKAENVADRPRKRIDEARDEFVAWHRTEGRRHRTTCRYDGILSVFEDFAAGKRVGCVSDIKLTLIDAYRTERKKSLSERSMHNEGQVIKAFLSWCEEREYLERNPLYRRKFSAPTPKARKAPTIEQVNAVLRNATELRLPQLAVAAFTGARSGECRNLRVEDVEFDNGWIFIRSRPGYETKSGEDRKVPMHPRLRSILEKLPRHDEGWFFRALPSARYPEGDHHINPKHLNEDFQKILCRLNIPTGRDEGFTLHSLRRFFRTMAVNAGVPERVIDLWIGHRSTKEMGTIYYHLSDEESQRFMKSIPFGEQPNGGQAS